jgi:hypothetical protein
VTDRPLPRVGYTYPRNPFLDFVRGPDLRGACPACRWRKASKCPHHEGYDEGHNDGYEQGWAAAAALAGVELPAPPYPAPMVDRPDPVAGQPGVPIVAFGDGTPVLVPLAEKHPRTPPKFELEQPVLFKGQHRMTITERFWTGVGYIYVAATDGGTGVSGTESLFTPALSVVPSAEEATR